MITYCVKISLNRDYLTSNQVIISHLYESVLLSPDYTYYSLVTVQTKEYLFVMYGSAAFHLSSCEKSETNGRYSGCKEHSC